MLLVSLSFCALIACLGSLGAVSPSRFLAIVRRSATLEGFYLVATLRVAFGAALYVTAPMSRAPILLSILGVVILVSGILTPIVGHARYRKVIDWWCGGSSLYIRVWAACSALVALVLAYLVLPVHSG